MKKLALGIITATALLSAAPAMAAGIYVGAGPVGVGVGVPGPYYSYGDCGYWNNYCNGPYYDYYPGPDVVIGGGGWHGGHGHWHGHR